jgi:hypothetical protein
MAAIARPELAGGLPMLRVRALLMLAIAVAVALPAVAADSTYRDPRQPSFTLLVPDGWTAASNNQGVTISREDSYFMLRVFPPSMSPGALLVQVRPQIEQQSKQFRELDAGRTRFGGLDATYVVYGGVPPSGVDSIQRIVAATNGQLTFGAFSGMPVKTPQRKAELERIERSFTPDPVR